MDPKYQHYIDTVATRLLDCEDTISANRFALFSGVAGYGLFLCVVFLLRNVIPWIALLVILLSITTVLSLLAFEWYSAIRRARHRLNSNLVHLLRSDREAIVKRLEDMKAERLRRRSMPERRRG